MASAKEREMNFIDVEDTGEWMYPPGSSYSAELLETAFYTLPWITSHDLIPLESDLGPSQRFLTHQGRNASTTEEEEGFP
jgi:hypothetical protein